MAPWCRPPPVDSLVVVPRSPRLTLRRLTSMLSLLVSIQLFLEFNLTHFASGGINASALVKFTQQHEAADKLKMAIVAQNGTYINPQAYFGVVHSNTKK